MLRFGERAQNFADTAALISELDLVISVDTSVAHLAGALGKPVWILLTHVPDWRWLLDRNDSPWYESARLFRPARDARLAQRNDARPRRAARIDRKAIGTARAAAAERCRRDHAFAVATSSSPRLRGSTPQAHTTTIWTSTSAIISQTTPGSL